MSREGFILDAGRFPRLSAEIGLAVGLLFVTAGAMPARAQAPNAADICTPNVMRLCSDVIPDRDRIVRCLRVESNIEVSGACVQALSQRPPKRVRQSKQ